MNQRRFPKERSRHALLLKLSKGKYDNCYYDLRKSVEEDANTGMAKQIMSP